MTKYTDRHSAVVAMLTQAINRYGHNMTDLQNKTGITRSQLHRWVNGSAKKIQQKSFHAVAQNLGYAIQNTEDGIEVTHHIQPQGEPEMLQQLKDKERIIALQDEKIQSLELQVKSTPSQLHEIAKTNWESFPTQLFTVTKIYIDKTQLGRKIISYDNLDIMSQFTGYSVRELENYWAIGKRFEHLSEHPINEIVTTESAKGLRSIANQVISAIDLIRSYILSVPMTIFVDYIAKDNSVVKSVSLCKVDWDTKIVESKTAFVYANELN